MHEKSLCKIFEGRMQTRIGKDGLAVDIDRICLAMNNVRDSDSPDLKLFCYGFRGDIKPFTFMGRSSQYVQVDYAGDGESRRNLFGNLEETTYDIIALDFSDVSGLSAVAMIKDAVNATLFARFKGLYSGKNPVFSVASVLDIKRFNDRSSYGAYGFRFVEGSRDGNVFNLGL